MVRSIVVLLSLFSFAAADEVRVDNRGKEVKRSGTITDLRGEHLILKLGSGREVKVPLDNVKSYEATWSSSHLEADRKYEAGKFAEALNLYRKAFNEERRSWVKRRILERVVWCYRNTGRVAEACKIFDRIVRDDSLTPYFDSIPLQWELKQCPASVKTLVGNWLESGADPARRLMAASWLLVQNRNRSLGVLRELGKSESKQVSSLALAQLWRAEILTMQEARLAWWEEQLATTPVDLRSGHYFLLGQSFARFGRADDAVLAFTRVPMMYPDEVTLGQRALSKAVDILQTKNTQEAIVLLQMSVELDATSAEGQRAKQKLAELIR